MNRGTWTEILCYIKQGRLFFWGAGTIFSVFLNYMEEYNIVLIPEIIIDNDIFKRNTQRKIVNKDVSVALWNDIQIQQNETIVIIITLAYYQDVLKQIRNSNNKDIHVFTYEYILGSYQEYEIRNKKLLYPIKRTEKQIIPKIIHYCWFGRQSLPEKNRKYIEGWKQKCPDYEIREWNESNYDVSKNLFMKQAWEKKYWAFATDYARLDIVYEFGGIYLDTDVEIIRNLDDLLYQNAFLGFESNQYVSTGLGFGAKKGHPLVQGMRDDYNDRRYMTDGTVQNCTHYQTNFLKQYGLVADGQHQHIGDMTIYPASVLCSCCFWGKREVKTPDSYTMHHFEGSWT